MGGVLSARAPWLACALAAGCGGSLPRAEAPPIPAEQARCRVAAGQQNPLVTEWPAAEKADLEARLGTGAVLVSYSGCELRVVPCRIAGSYSWRRTSTATDTIELHDEDELYAKVPLAAATLSGELARSGRLAIETSVAGQLRLEGLDRSRLGHGECTRATHVVTAVSVGAFALHSGGSKRAAAGVGVPVGQVGAATSHGETLVRTAGSPERCREATDREPHPECRSPIQVFLTPLASFAVAPPAAPAPPGPWPPAATVEHKPLQERNIVVDFESAEPEAIFAVVANGEVVCTTPCRRSLPLNAAVRLRVLGGRDGPKNKLHEIRVPLRDYAGMDRLRVRASPYQSGRMAGGVVLAALGGLGLMGGALALAIGGHRESTGAVVVGGVAMAAGAAAIPTGIVFILGSRADVEILPSGAPPGPSMSLGAGQATLRW